MLEDTITALRDAGVLVLADAKRGDIGSTMAAYASAWVGDSPLSVDAVTASPYLGFGSLQPLLDGAADNGRGVFVLAATSNPEGAGVQCAQTDGRTVAQSIVDAAAAVNRVATPDPGSVGVVVGATVSAPPDVSALGGPVLVPGVGAQGGRPDALRGFGGSRSGQLLPAVSRELLRAGPNAAALRAAAGEDARCRGVSGLTAWHPVVPRRLGYLVGLQRNPLSTKPESPTWTVSCGHRLYLLAVPVERLVIEPPLVDAALVPIHRSSAVVTGTAVPVVVVVMARWCARRIAGRPPGVSRCGAKADT